MAAPTIRGTITKSGKPLGGAYVRLTGPSGEFVAEVYTKDEGDYTFFVADGSWTVAARAAGVTGQTHSVNVAGGAVDLDIALA